MLKKTIQIEQTFFNGEKPSTTGSSSDTTWAIICGNCGFLISDVNPFCMCHAVVKKMKEGKSRYFWKLWEESFKEKYA